MGENKTPFMTRLRNAFNIFNGREFTEDRIVVEPFAQGVFHTRLPRSFHSGPQSLIGAVQNRIALEVAARTFRQVKLDLNGHIGDFPSTGLNECLSFRPNIDQTPSQFIHDLASSIMDWGVAAVVPVDTDVPPTESGTYDILSLRVGEIVQYYPASVRLKVYNDRTGQREEITLPKQCCAIITNPLYAVMNQPNGTLSRLAEKLSLLDTLDKSALSGKLDLILQLPYTVRSERRSEEAQRRLDNLEKQLKDSAYGIAYVDGTERITQLNRPVENNLVQQIDKLTEELYNRLGMSKDVFSGTATSTVMSNFQNLTIDPIVKAITEAMTSVFLTKTARSQGHRVVALRDYFRDVTTTEVGSLIDTFVRNEILSPNEIRHLLGYMPADDPMADELRNANINPKAPSTSSAPLDKPLEEDYANPTA